MSARIEKELRKQYREMEPNEFTIFKNQIYKNILDDKENIILAKNNAEIKEVIAYMYATHTLAKDVFIDSNLQKGCTVKVYDRVFHFENIPNYQMEKIIKKIKVKGV